MINKNEKIESIVILILFYTLIIISALLVSSRFKEISIRESNCNFYNEIKTI